MPRMMMLLMTSHFVQLARVAARCSGVDVPNTSPWIFCWLGASVQRLTAMTMMMQMSNLHFFLVQVVEYILEQGVSGIRHVTIIYFGAQTGQTDNHT